MKRFGTSEQQLHVEVHPQEMLHPQFRKSTVLTTCLKNLRFEQRKADVCLFRLIEDRP